MAHIACLRIALRISVWHITHDSAGHLHAGNGSPTPLSQPGAYRWSVASRLHRVKDLSGSSKPEEEEEEEEKEKESTTHITPSQMPNDSELRTKATE